MGWTFPSDVDGWLSEAEGKKLAELAAGKRVLEIGSYKGRSTVCMAQTAGRVECIDPFDGRATPRKENTLRDLLANLQRYGVRDKTTAYPGTTAEIAPKLTPGFDLVFIDGDHSRAAVELDIKHALRLLRPGGLIAFHDYRKVPGEIDGRFDPGVTAAVEAFLAGGAELLERVDSLAVVRPGAGSVVGDQPTHVALCMPRRGPEALDGAARGYYLWPTLRRECTVSRLFAESSLLNHCFNSCWAGALSLRPAVTHFAMIHNDVCPQQGWLDILLDEMNRTGADMVSAVVPMKGPEGLTSTAIQGDNHWFSRRLTMREVFDLPETFGPEDVGAPLLLNTGLWVCDFRSPWVEKAWFSSKERIVKVDDGSYKAQCISEDWLFSRVLNGMGLRLRATRKARLHHGEDEDCTNARPWGTWATDEVYQGASHAKNQVQQNGDHQERAAGPTDVRGGEDLRTVRRECAALD